MKTFNQYYFAFGSNLNTQRLKSRRVDIDSKTPAFITGYKLTFDKQATGKVGETFANIQPEKDGTVEGLLYLTNMESIRNLDGFEGVHSNHYVRKEMEVIIKDTQKKVKAWVYVAHHSKITEGKPTKEYLNHILSAKEFLSESYYKELLSRFI